MNCIRYLNDLAKSGQHKVVENADIHNASNGRTSSCRGFK